MLHFGRSIGGFELNTPDQTNAESLFLQLPREIRDSVYQLVFETETTYICLKPAIHPTIAPSPLRLCTYSADGRHAGIDLSLFTVCKFINEESKEFFWCHKILLIEPTDWSFQCRHFRNVQHVRVELDGTHPESTDELVEYLERWVEAGTLKTLDVNVVPSRESLLYASR